MNKDLTYMQDNLNARSSTFTLKSGDLGGCGLQVACENMLQVNANKYLQILHYISIYLCKRSANIAFQFLIIVRIFSRSSTA